jgi:hypothetical protein
MTTWSWAYIRWASGFGLKTGCDTHLLYFSIFSIWKNGAVWFCKSEHPVLPRQNSYLFPSLFPVDLRTICNVWTYEFKIVISIWTLIMLIYEFMFIAMSFMPKCVFMNAWNPMVNVDLLICSVWKNWMVWCFKSDVLVFLAKPDVPVCQTEVSGFGKQNIWFSFN